MAGKIQHVRGWFSHHHAIERQTLFTGLALFTLGTSFVMSQVHYNHVKYELLEKVDQAGVSSNFSKSSDTSVTLGKTHLSSDRKTAYIPLTLSSTDQVGIKAKNYRFYILDSSNQAMTYRITGHFVMYGTTGRGVLVLNSNTRINNQPLTMFMVNQKHIPNNSISGEDSTMDNANDNGAAADDTNGNSFGKFDVAPFRINPGAVDVAKHERVDTEYTNVEELYERMFGSGDFDQVDKTIKSDQRQIKKDKMSANALRERLENAGYEVPKNPSWWSSSWRPHDAINISTGKTANGHDALTYEASSSDDDENSNNDFPDNLKNKDGTTTADADSSSNDGNDSSSSSSASSNSTSQVGGTQSDPNTQWQNLTAYWEDMKTLKRDIYVVQYQRLYKIHRQVSSIINQASIGPSKNVAQRGKVKVEEPKK